MWKQLLVLSALIQFFPLSAPASAWQAEAAVYLQIITLKTPAELERTLALLKAGQEFSDLAQKYSTHASASNGGIWGPIHLNELPSAVREQIKPAEEGTLLHFFDPTLGHTILRKLNSAAARQAIFQQTFNRGAAHLQRNEKEQALKELKKAVALDPRSAAAHQLLGQAYLLQGSYEMLGEAKSEFVQALSFDPALIWSRFYLARIYLDLGLPQKAKDQLEAALQTRPNVPHLLSLLGEANRKLGKLDLSVEQNKRALEVDQSFFVAHYYLGLAYRDLNQEEEAIREFEAAVKPGYPAAEMYLTLGDVYLKKGNLERASELFQKAVAAAPAQLEGHLRMAQVYRLKKQPDLALKELALAAPEGQRIFSTPYYQQLQAEIFFERGLVYQEKKALTQALEAYTKALELDPNHGPTHRQLAEVLFRQGDYARAMEEAVKAEELKSPIAPAVLERIKAKQRADK